MNHYPVNKYCDSNKRIVTYQVPVVPAKAGQVWIARKVDNIILLCFVNTYPLDNDLSSA